MHHILARLVVFLLCAYPLIAFEILSPSSIAGAYISPPCQNNHNVDTDDLPNTTRKLVYIDFDFCGEYTGDELKFGSGSNGSVNAEEVVLLIGYYSCYASTKAQYAKQLGAKYIIIESRVQPPGLEVHYDNVAVDGLVCVYMDFVSFTEVRQYWDNNITILLTEGKTPLCTKIYHMYRIQHVTLISSIYCVDRCLCECI